MPVTVPNLITIARLVLVPVVVSLIAEGRYDLAFLLFAVAGASDALDGYLARRFDLRSELGAYLDPLADKALLVSIFITLGIEGVLPRWLVILVVSRDVLILAAFLLSWILGKPVEVRPIRVSKANTLCQITLVGLVLFEVGFDLGFGPLRAFLVGLAAGLTVVSAGAYLVAWLGHMSDGGAGARTRRGGGEAGTRGG